jgi:hypothetical protein
MGLKKVQAEALHDLYCRIPEELFRRIKAIADRHQRSVTGEVTWALQQYANQEEPGFDSGMEAGIRPKPRRKLE